MMTTLYSIHGSSSCTTYKSCYSMLPANSFKVAIFTISIVCTQPNSILLLGLGLLHPRIPPIPPELLVRDPLAEDRPVDVRSDLKKESAYMNMKLNTICLKLKTIEIVYVRGVALNFCPSHRTSAG